MSILPPTNTPPHDPNNQTIQEMYLETGVHPEVERAQREAAQDSGFVSLPDHDQHRPFVFWDITVDNKPTGVYGCRCAQLPAKVAGAGICWCCRLCACGGVGACAGMRASDVSIRCLMTCAHAFPRCVSGTRVQVQVPLHDRVFNATFFALSDAEAAS